MFAAYTKMWKNTFNYRGLTSRKDYWLATLLWHSHNLYFCHGRARPYPHASGQ